MIKFNVAKLLKIRGMTQYDLEIRTKIRPGTINAYYHGFAKRLNVKDINKLCRVLDCTTGDLIEYVSKKKKI